MKSSRIVIAFVAAGAVALAMVGCTHTAQAGGDGQGYRAGRYAANVAGEEPAVRGAGSGRLASEAPRALERRETVDPASDRTGREVAETGALQSLSGTLAEQDGEWYLDAGAGRFLLHLGNESYVEETGLDLRAGASAGVRGFVDGEEVSVVSVTVAGETYALRTDDGRPLWAGGGRRAATNGGRAATGSGGGGQGRAAGQGRANGTRV